MLRRIYIAATICLAFSVVGTGVWLRLRLVQSPLNSEPAKVPAILKHAFELAPANLDHELESPDIAVDSLGRIFLVWASREKESQKTMYLSVSRDNGESFSEPRVVSRTAVHETMLHADEDSHHEIGMSPHISASGEKVTAAWIQSVAENSTVCLVSVESNDGGQSFSSPISVNQSLKAFPNFTSLVTRPKEQAYCWLDRRDDQRQVFTALAGESATPEEQIVFKTAPSDRACQCCPTAMAFSSDGQLFVVFREADEILLAQRKSNASRFEPIIIIAKVASQGQTCGHDCPSLAIDEERLHISWTDASKGVLNVQCSSAKLANLVFENVAINPQTVNTQTSCKLLTVGGVLHAVWEETPPVEQFISTRGHDHSANPVRVVKHSVRKSGERVFSPALSVDDVQGDQSHPVIASNSSGDIFVAWNLSSDRERVVMLKKLSRSSNDGATQ